MLRLICATHSVFTVRLAPFYARDRLVYLSDSACQAIQIYLLIFRYPVFRVGADGSESCMMFQICC